jgi:hypothetical protein
MPVRPLEILQTNANHCARAQDLIMQVMAEWGVCVAAVAEPWCVPPQPNWAAASDGSVALIVPAIGAFLPLVVLDRGPGYVAAEWERMVVVATYFSPNRPLIAFEGHLENLARVLRREAPKPVLLMGDLNAKSAAWGSPVTDARGETLRDWAVTMGLAVVNQGRANTCVRWQGGSIVDITLATPVIADRIGDWRVLEEVETLSDHMYIRMRVSPSRAAPSPVPVRRHAGGGLPRWSLASLDRELAEEAALMEAWSVCPRGLDTVDRAVRFRASLTRVCDAAMRRARRMPGKDQVYWWSPEIAALRTTANAARREFTRSRRRRNSAEEEEVLRATLTAAKEALTVAISKRKDEAREEFICTLDRDPWGRPYKIVRNKMKHASPMDSLEPELLARVVEGLFPAALAFVPPVMAVPEEEEVAGENIPGVNDVEILGAVVRLRSCKKAPGPDGVPGKIIPVAMKHLGLRLRELFDDCLKEGVFPRPWKEGRLCLLRKEGRPADSPSGYRPIVLLDEVGKMLERIIARRILKHLEDAGPNLSERQFGFREGRSTIDAVGTLREFAEVAKERGEGAIAVSLDIANAFGSLPYEVIREALRYHRVPPYLRAIVGHYLSERVVLYEGAAGRQERRMECGVPQGSVLGPLLWNIGFDWAIRGAQLPRMVTICYADDTMVAVRGREYLETLRMAAVATELTVGRIGLLGLRVSLPKTDAVVFGGRGWRLRADETIPVGGEAVQVKAHIKYLGLILDRKWDFGEHFRQLAPRLVGTASALGRLLPNVGGPKAPCRRLFANVVRSMALYGAPIWADKLKDKTKALLRRPQRVIAQRMARCYRTVAFAAACALAGSLPWELDARLLAERHRDRVADRTSGEFAAPQEVAASRRRAVERERDRWKEVLEESPYGTRTIGALLPSLEGWLDRRNGDLTYRLAQVMTGHGCFGHYLHRIRRETSPVCHHCGEDDDTAQHTLAECTGWAVERQNLRVALGTGDLSLRNLVSCMLGSETSWKAAVTFCENVLSQKEKAEREREERADAPPLRRRRVGRRRLQFINRQLPQ